ncbi:hypothetical protein C9374_005717 [Naegleria lovaniensis]|uniref:Uncharacterized protein n=1 Tax=Naegleria lovaniensis TaxID=51637 RepID=A0AA88GKL6_NAELO|nr:uncharacterized protein C9374_005717 [Naegleria lovaniensis]KAG2381925.1 hypothetical protein C9374_005717 [Naegleria lovaniensis]
MFTASAITDVNPSTANQTLSIQQISEFWRDFLTISSGSSILKELIPKYQNVKLTNNILYAQYRGFPSRFHAEVFYNMANERLDCENMSDFISAYFSLSEKPQELKELYNRIVKRNIKQLATFVDSETPKIMKRKLLQASPEHFKRIPYILIHGRYLPQQAAFLLYHWLEFIEQSLENREKDIMNRDENEWIPLISARLTLIQRLKKAIVWYTHGETDKIENYINRKNNSDVKPSLRGSCMPDRFKPLIALPKINFLVVNKILSDADLQPISIENMNTISEYYNLLDTLENLCGVGEQCVLKYILRNRKNSPPTKTAVYFNLLSHEERKNKLHKSLWHFRKYNKCLAIVGKLRGRLETCFDPFVTGQAARVDKSGMMTLNFKTHHYYFNENSVESILKGIDIPSLIFSCVAVSLFSVRKQFTLRSQMQGSLDPFLSYILNICKSRAGDTQWDLIASIHPLEDVMCNLNKEEAQHVLTQVISYQIPLAKFMKAQWEKGVKDCVQSNMKVPRSGSSSVNSTGWNVVVGAYCNSLRFIRALSRSLDTKPPLLIKSMRLTAADQMYWAKLYGLPLCSDLLVFQALTSIGITPWDIILNQVESVSAEQIIKICEKHKVDPSGWLGIRESKHRYTDKSSTAYQDQICGVCVPSIQYVQMILKTLGAFGYKSKN